MRRCLVRWPDESISPEFRGLWSVSAKVSCIPRFSRHPKCLSNKAVLSGVQNFASAIGKPVRNFFEVYALSTSSVPWRQRRLPCPLAARSMAPSNRQQHCQSSRSPAPIGVHTIFVQIVSLTCSPYNATLCSLQPLAACDVIDRRCADAVAPTRSVLGTPPACGCEAVIPLPLFPGAVTSSALWLFPQAQQENSA